MEIPEMIELLYSKDANLAYDNLKKLEEISKNTKELKNQSYQKVIKSI